MKTDNNPQDKAADADILGNAVKLKPAGQPGDAATPGGAPRADRGEGNLQEPRPAEDENQPGFVGERNRPQP